MCATLRKYILPLCRLTINILIQLNLAYADLRFAPDQSKTYCDNKLISVAIESFFVKV